MRKRLLAMLFSSFIVATMVSGCAAVGAPEPEFYQKDEDITELNINGMEISYATIEDNFLNYIDSLNLTYIIYDSSELTTEILENRTGSLIIERCVGVVEDAGTGDGRVLNAHDKEFDYISYRGLEGTRDGTILVSYMVYNPLNNYIDDIIERYDFVYSKGNENMEDFKWSNQN